MCGSTFVRPWSSRVSLSLPLSTSRQTASRSPSTAAHQAVVRRSAAPCTARRHVAARAEPFREITSITAWLLKDDTETGTCTTPVTTCHSFSGHTVVSSFVHAFSVSQLSSATASMAQEERQSEFHPSAVMCQCKIKKVFCFRRSYTHTHTQKHETHDLC